MQRWCDAAKHTWCDVATGKPFPHAAWRAAESHVVQPLAVAFLVVLPFALLFVLWFLWTSPDVEREAQHEHDIPFGRRS